MTPTCFVEAIQALNFENTFNPYSNRCEVFDYDDAPRRRSEALLTILGVATRSEVDSLWIGRDLGHRGGRRTGLAFTDDASLGFHAKRWDVLIKRPTKGTVMGERTATVIWSVLNQIDNTIFLWNVFPLHPHEPDNPFSNRSHTARERQAGEDLLYQLIHLLRPKKLVAIGNDAAQTALRLQGNRDVFRIRHPSYGGQNEFLKQTRDLYKILK